MVLFPATWTIAMAFSSGSLCSVISSVCWHLYIYIVKRRHPRFVGGAIEIPLIDWLIDWKLSFNYCFTFVIIVVFRLIFKIIFGLL